MLQDFRKPARLRQETQVQACASKTVTATCSPVSGLQLNQMARQANEMNCLFVKYAKARAKLCPCLSSATSQTASSPSKQLPLIPVFGRLLLAGRGLLKLTLGRQRVVARLFGRGHALRRVLEPVAHETLRSLRDRGCAWPHAPAGVRQLVAVS